MELRAAIVHHEFLLDRVNMILNKTRYTAFQAHLQTVLIPLLIKERATNVLIRSCKDLMRDDEFDSNFKDLGLKNDYKESNWTKDCDVNLKQLKEWYNKEYEL